MKLKWMSFKNFRLFRQNYIDLSGVHLASIIGRYSSNWSRSNEAGKSTIGEGLMYLLFDYCATTSADELISWGHGEEGLEVEGEFEYEGQTCKLKRSWRAVHKQGILKGNFEFLLNGAKQGKNQAEAKKLFSQFIGIDANIAFATWFFLQGEADKLTSSDPSARKEYLASVLKAEYDDAYEIAKQKLKDSKEKLEQAKASKARSAELALQIAEAEGSVKQAKDQETSLSEHEQKIIGELSQVAQQLGEIKERAKSVERLPGMQSELSQTDQWISQLVLKAKEAISKSEERTRQLNVLESEHEQQLTRSSEITKNIGDLKSQWAERGYSADHNEWHLAARSKVSDTAREIDDRKRKKAEAEKTLSVDWSGKTQCPTCGQSATPEHLHGHFAQIKGSVVVCDQEIAAFSSQLALHEAEAKAVKESYDFIRSQESALHEITSKELKYSSEREHHAQLTSFAKQTVEQLRAEHDQYTTRRASLSAEIAKLEAVNATASIDQLEKREASLKVEQQKAVSGRMQQSSLVTQWQTHADALRASKADIDALVDQTSDLEKQVRVRSVVAELFHRDGLALLKIKQAAGLIQHHANTMLAEVLPDYSIKVVVDNHSGKRGILDFRVNTASGEHSYACFSGGARKVIDICLRMSLSKILAEGSGRTFRTLFLDEVMADLDEVNREAMMKLIKALSRSFASIYVISHEKEIQTAFPQVVLVERSGGSSQLTVVDTSSI